MTKEPSKRAQIVMDRVRQQTAGSFDAYFAARMTDPEFAAAYLDEAAMIRAPKNIVQAADEPSVEDDTIDEETKQEFIKDLSRVLNRYAERHYYDENHWFWDEGLGVFKKAKEYWDKEILEALKNSRETDDLIERAMEAGVADEEILEAAWDYAAYDSNSSELRVEFGSEKSGDEERYVIEIVEEGRRYFDDYNEGFVPRLLASLTEADWQIVSDHINGGSITIREGTEPLANRAELSFETGNEIYFGLSNDRRNNSLRDFRARLEAIVEEAEDQLADSIEQTDERGPATDNIIYRPKHPQFVGYYLADLPPSALADEGEEVGHCVGDPRQGYIAQVYKGRVKILSLRKESGASLLTFEVRMRDDKPDSVAQIKGKGNRVPGFADAKQSQFVRAKEVAVCVEILQHLGIDPEDVNDMKPGLRALQRQEQPPAITSAVEVHCGFCRRPTQAGLLELLARRLQT